MPANRYASGPVTGPRPRWDTLPGDPPVLTRWLARQREEQAAREPLPPAPEAPAGDAP